MIIRQYASCVIRCTLCFLCIYPTIAQASDLFNYTDIANLKDNFPNYNFLQNALAMNNEGEIVFSVQNTIQGTSTLYKGDGEELVLIRQPNVGDHIAVGNQWKIGINDNGAVAFSESVSGALPNLYYSLNGSISLLVSGAEYSYKTASDINNSNQVSFFDSTFSDMIITDGGTPVAYHVSNFSGIGNPVINDEGHPAVMWRDIFGNIKIIKGMNEFGVQEITLGSFTDFGFPNNQLGLNNRGNISYFANGSTIKEIGFLSDEGKFSLLDINDGFQEFRGNTSINDWNQILFAANKSSTGSSTGLYLVDPSGDLHLTVVEVGDVINGKEVLGFYPEAEAVFTSSLNDAAQVAFIARVQDVDNPGSFYYAVFRANPLEGVVPENPVLPDGPPDDTGGWTIPACNTIARCFVDPDFAIGYHYSLSSNEAPSFESVLIPVPLPGGDDTFVVSFNGSTAELKAGTPYYFTDLFPDGVREFNILDISVDEELSPDDPTAFVTGLTFVDIDLSPFSIIMTPITDNSAPSIGELVITDSLAPVGDEVLLEAVLTDTDLDDVLTAQINWGDGIIGTYYPALSSGEALLSASHTYHDVGIYTVEVTVSDSNGESATATYKYVVIYDPSGAFVTGGGWFDSPLGAYVPDPSLVGKADFGFVAKYNKGKNVPDGNTQFKFSAGELNFESANYQWLIVSGSKAQYKGDGKINDEGDYGFILTANDGDINNGVDSFRIKIWDRNTETVIYDNQILDSDNTDPTTVLGAGNIVIHTSKKK